MRSIFVFAYYSYKDPVFQSAVLPYLQLKYTEPVQFILLTWEQEAFKLGQEERKEISGFLKEQNIQWYATKWHSGRFKLVKKVYDFLAGLWLSLRLIRKHKCQKIYSEGFPGAIIGHYLSKLSAKPHIIHTFEPHADYMLESSVWQKSSWEYRFLKKMEIPIAKHAQHIITATEAYKDILIQKGIKSSIHRIPSCINTNHYYYDEISRERIRSDLGISEDQIVIVYLGKIGGMYMEDELFDFFKHCLNLNKEKFRFFLFTNHDYNLVIEKLHQFGISQHVVHLKYLGKDEVPKYLSASDIAFCGIKPIPSRRFSSPIKNGEYWACGLPTLIPKGISDDYVIVENENIGKSFVKVEDIKITDLENLLAITRTKVRALAIRERSIESYFDNFSKIFSLR